jgi:hypothetical protein
MGQRGKGAGSCGLPSEGRSGGGVGQRLRNGAGESDDARIEGRSGEGWGDRTPDRGQGQRGATESPLSSSSPAF